MIIRKSEELEKLMDKLGEYVESKQAVSVIMDWHTIAHFHDVLFLSKMIKDKLETSKELTKKDFDMLLETDAECSSEMTSVIYSIVKVFENNKEKVLIK